MMSHPSTPDQKTMYDECETPNKDAIPKGNIEETLITLDGLKAMFASSKKIIEDLYSNVHFFESLNSIRMASKEAASLVKYRSKIDRIEKAIAASQKKRNAASQKKRKHDKTEQDEFNSKIRRIVIRDLANNKTTTAPNKMLADCLITPEIKKIVHDGWVDSVLSTIQGITAPIVHQRAYVVQNVIPTLDKETIDSIRVKLSDDKKQWKETYNTIKNEIKATFTTVVD